MAIPRGIVEQVLELLPLLVKADELVAQDIDHGKPVQQAFADRRK